MTPGILLLAVLVTGTASASAVPAEASGPDAAPFAQSATGSPTRAGEAEPDEEPADAEALIVDDYLEVRGTWRPIPTIEVLSRDDLPSMPAGDAAELLRGIAGVSLGRMGGHGLEPRIRGLGESNLNILVDGAYVHGGCPNRMDPPTSFASTSGLDRVTVLKGVQSLRYGAGGNAGTVLYERQRPERDGEMPWRIAAQSTLGGWSERPELALDAAWTGERFYLRADAESRDFDSYEDGSGATVRSAYRSRLANVMVGLGDRHRGLVELGFEQSRTDDALFAGAGMDSPEDRGDTFRLRFRRQEAAGRWLDFEADLYLSQVDHLMDNYTLRDRTAPMALRVPSTSDTSGGRASARLDLGPRTGLTLGLDVQRNERQALRFAGPTADTVDRLQSVMWPRAEIGQDGLFLEGDRVFGDGPRLRWALRYDSFSASARAADRQPVGANQSPNQLYRLYYGRPAADWSADGASALLRYERRLEPGWTVFAGASRSLRAADATERYLGAGGAAPVRRWVGNPHLELSTHRQLDLGFGYALGGSRWSATAFLDSADDFILRDRARGQDGILQADGATVYRNVEARLIGLELDGRWPLTSIWTVHGNAGWVRGDNRTDDRPLAQIPPAQGQLAALYSRGAWGGAATVRWALAQDRVDDDPRVGSGLDFGPSAGYALADVEATFRWRRGLEIALAVDNVFDRTYAGHLNRGNVFDPDPVRVNEPGRAVWLRMRWLGGAAKSPSQPGARSRER